MEASGRFMMRYDKKEAYYKISTASNLQMVSFSQILQVNYAQSATKTWKFTNDILDPINWEGGEPAKGCKGVIFPKVLGSVGSVFELYVDELVLPINGELEIRQGGYIQFSKNDICLRIKKLQHRHWLSPESWDYGKNAAVPDGEKVPCMRDDVVFPAGATVAVVYPEMPISVNSIRIGGVSLSDDQWKSFLQTEYGDEQFMYAMEYQTEINIAPRICMSRSGCTCHYADDELYWVCEHKEKREEAPCMDPIRPIGHCNDICGGVILLEVPSSFVLDEFQKQIPNYEKVDSYASKVNRNGKHMIQVVFVEKTDYSELSSDAASAFHSTILKDLNGFKVTSAFLEISGIRLTGSQWATAFGIILGTLMASLLVFAAAYVFYMGPLENYNLSSRIPFREVSLRNLRPFLFAKFENRDEGQMSMAASMVSLEKAFDNPMFGTQRPSTSSAGVEVVVLTETQPSTSETTHENPAYGKVISKTVEMEDVEDTEE